MSQFKLKSQFQPRGDQPKAIKQLASGLKKYPQQTLLGVTGSGKTFTVANVIAQVQKPTLVLSHNKTLAAQLYNEFSNFFPENKVCYFVSYYDYYQPESYLPETDTYIEKDTLINEKIERLRLEAASSLLSRDDVIVVASVSCIYGLGKPQDFEGESIKIKIPPARQRPARPLASSLAGEVGREPHPPASSREASRAGAMAGGNSKIPARLASQGEAGGQISNEFSSPHGLAKKLISIQYERNDLELKPGRFRIRGDVLDLVQGSGTTVIRIEWLGEKIERIAELHPITGRVINELKEIWLFPAKPFVTPEPTRKKAIESIRKELQDWLPQLGPLEAYRLNQRTNYDLEMIEQLGYCKGIENYSRHFDGRKPGEPPFTLLDFFKYKNPDFLLIIDESHQTLPQVKGMYEGDYSRKKNLVDYGFRLPSAFDNRPLKFKEFEKYLNHVIYTSATPAEYELKYSGQVAEQIIRPTGLVDPLIEVRPTENQINDLISEIKKTTNNGYRILVTTLTKRTAEDLSYYLSNLGIKTEYLHSEIETLERNEIIKRLRLGKFDVLVGINLLREGLDLPEVALIAVLDADKEGFLRDTRSLIQTIGRAARNVESKVIMYADMVTGSMREAIDETNRRRKIQKDFNKKHGITPKSIVKAIAEEEVVIEPGEKGKELELDQLIIDLELQMRSEAEALNFERAIELRDKIQHLKSQLK